MPINDHSRGWLNNHFFADYENTAFVFEKWKDFAVGCRLYMESTSIVAKIEPKSTTSVVGHARWNNELQKFIAELDCAVEPKTQKDIDEFLKDREGWHGHELSTASKGKGNAGNP